MPKHTLFRFVANIAPKSMIDGSETGGDIPALQDTKTQNLPGDADYSEGADMRWDVSRRTRAKVLNPAPTSIVHTDYIGPPTDIKAFNAKANAFPGAAITLFDFPTDDVFGNDDIGTGDEDNNPYSDAEFLDEATGMPPTFKAKIGQVASWDKPNSPGIRVSPGKKDETVEVRTQFGEFVRLQIGNTNVPGYRNWYRVSDFSDWQAVMRYRRTDAGMVDDGSTASPDNKGW